MMMFERDPEELGDESYEDVELRMDVQQSIHRFDPGPDGKCRAHLIRHGVQGVVCGSRDKWSVFHDNPEAEFYAMHDHGGGDCMCFEDERGPSFHEAMRRWCYPTDEERAEEERQREIGRRRNRRIRMLTEGGAIERIGKSVVPDDPDVHRKINRMLKLHAWGVGA